MIFFISYILLILVVFINADEGSNISKNSVTVTDGNLTINRFSLKFYDKYLPKTSIVKYDLSAKIAYLSSFDKLAFYMGKYSDLYNNRWIFLIDDSFVWIQMENFINYKRPNFIAFIWEESIKNMDFFYLDYPVFIADRTTFNAMKKYMIDNEKGNYFLNIIYSNSQLEYPEQYLTILSKGIAGIAAVVSLLWHLNTYTFNQRNSLPLHKVLSSLPYIKMALSVLIVYYVKIFSEDPFYDNQNTLMRVYLDTIITTLSAIFKTIFWFCFILISCGWQLYRQILTRNEMRKFVSIYIFIYLSVCFDQILDLMIKPPFANFEFSELKNFVIYSLLALIALYNTWSSLVFLKQKYNYAYILAPEYLPSLALKMNMLLLHIVVIVTYTALYILSVIVQKCYLQHYSSPVLTLVNNNSLEMIALLFYLLIFRSKRYPQYFNMIYNTEDFKENSNVYQCKLPSLGKLASSANDFGFINKLSKKELRDQLEAPFIIVNPIFPEDVGVSTKFEINRSDSIGSGRDNLSSRAHQVSIIDKIVVGIYKP